MKNCLNGVVMSKGYGSKFSPRGLPQKILPSVHFFAHVLCPFQVEKKRAVHARSTRGLGSHPLKVETSVRIWLG